METAKKQTFITPQRTAFVALFAALICVCSWIAVPNPFSAGVNFTLQTFAVILAGLILEPVEALLVGAVYLLLGLVGLPVMSGFATLYARFPTAAGGYIIGFYITPVIISLIKTAVFSFTDKKEMSGSAKNSVHFVTYLILAIVVGILAVDIPGMIQGMYITKMSFKAALTPFAISFLPTDIIKCVAAAFAASALEKPLKMIRRK